MSAEQWLKDNRCPHCVNGRNCKGGYKVRKSHEGWHCHGYRSKHWDERLTFRREKP